MFAFVLLSALLVSASAEFCYPEVEAACSTAPTTDGALLKNCNAKYGSFENMQTDLQAYTNAHIESSFEYLLMSSHFGNYEANREGFKGLYRKLSDNAWQKAIDMIQFITKRGGTMNFNQLPHFKKTASDSRVLELNEIGSLAKALDTEKVMAEEALRLHAQTQNHPKQDAAVAHYLEEEFMEAQADCIRKLAGHSNDLKNLLQDRDASLSIFLFDEYLQKTL
ncbi:uncharacterized protein LOC122502891 [Leptopilina heterotoma]|uniref:uncharacterized protein LOC122502891 n=1 Tax=Leptopilina heterotoma TaxID=63436 RepID=UPI001CA90E99|nr:uncharacterized protein LOC122502891 [Leptopilina heterotoma]